MNKRGVTAFYATFAVLIVGVVGFVVWKIFQKPPEPFVPETTVTKIAEASTVRQEPEATTERPADEGGKLTAPNPINVDFLSRSDSILSVPSSSSTISTTVSDTTCEKHNWAPATCVSPRKCRVCGATEETTLSASSTTVCNHNWVISTKPCVEPMVCSKCGATKPNSLTKHNWAEANCSNPRTCRACGKTEGSINPDNHVYVKTSFGYFCKNCGKENPNKSMDVSVTAGSTSTTTCNHNWVASSQPCKVPSVCSKCGAQKPDSLLPHNWMMANCSNPRTCRACGQTEGDVNPSYHVYTQTSDGIRCKYCGKKSTSNLTGVKVTITAAAQVDS